MKSADSEQYSKARHRPFSKSISWFTSYIVHCISPLMTLTCRQTVHAKREFNATNDPSQDDLNWRDAKGNPPRNRKGLTSWQNALSEVQTVLRRARTDPDLSQRSIFTFCAPLVSFGYLFAVCLVLFRLSRANVALLGVMDDIGCHKFVLAMSVATVTFGMLGVIACLRAMIWAIAYGVGMFVEMDIGFLESKEDSPSVELSGVNLLFGGILM